MAPKLATVRDPCTVAGSLIFSAAINCGCLWTAVLTKSVKCYADTKTKFAQHGDVGTQVLKPLEGVEPPVYRRGGIAEVSWTVRNNHGGGCE
jgi:hypothetical protein